MKDEVFWLLVAAGVLFLISRNAAAPVYGFTDESSALAFEADLLGQVTGPRNVAIANQTVQPPFQGGTRSPANVQATVDAAAAGFPTMFY